MPSQLINTDTGQLSLTPEQVKQFHTEGYLGPLTAFSPEEMTLLRPQIEAAIQSDPPDHDVHGHNRHLDTRVIWDVSTHPAIIEKMTSIVGADLMMWRTNFFTKEPGGLEIPWHQDANYWPLEPEIVISAWMAIDASTVENSCVQVAPGTHRKLLPHIESPPGMQFKEMADVSSIDMSKTIDVEMQPGQFMLFNERTLHHSEPNRSDKRRMGLAIRAVLPQVRVLEFDSPNHKLVQICGRNPLGFNPMTDPPAKR